MGRRCRRGRRVAEQIRRRIGVGLVLPRRREQVGRVGATGRALVARGRRCSARTEVAEIIDRAQPQPIAKTLAPRVGLDVALAGGKLGAHFLRGQRTDLLAVHDQVPHRVARAARGRCAAVGDRRGGLVAPRKTIGAVGRALCLLRRAGTIVATHDDDVAALLATDLEDLAPDLLVRDRVFRRAVIANDLHETFSPLPAAEGPIENGHRILGAPSDIRKLFKLLPISGLPTSTYGEK